MTSEEAPSTMSPPGSGGGDLHTKVTMSQFWEEHARRIIGAIAVLTLALGTVVYYLLEDWSWVDSFYFSSVALTTVGFGDLSPTTTVSKLFTVVYIFGGVALIGLFLNELLKGLGRRVASHADGVRRGGADN
jgi:hypothetical protein